MMKFGYNVFILRSELGLKQEQLASRVGISQSMLSNIETNKILPQEPLAMRLLEALGYSQELLTSYIAAQPEARRRQMMRSALIRHNLATVQRVS